MFTRRKSTRRLSEWLILFNLFIFIFFCFIFFPWGVGGHHKMGQGYQRLWLAFRGSFDLHELPHNGQTPREQAETEKCALALTAFECARKCLLFKLIINLATVSVSNYSVWVALFPISTLLCTLACCRPRGAVNLYIDLPVCFPLLTPHSSFRWSVTSPPLSINPPFAICPKVSDAKCMTVSLNPHFPPKWNLRTHKPKKPCLDMHIPTQTHQSGLLGAAVLQIGF